MNKTLLYLFIVLVGFAASCKKSSTGPKTVAVQAIVANRNWESYSAAVTLTKSPSLHLIIQADSANTHMRLDIGNYAGTGTYNLLDSTNTATYTDFNNNGGHITHTATSGEIVITKDTLRATGGNEFIGTFKFLGDTLTVVNGSFDVMLYLN